MARFARKIANLHEPDSNLGALVFSTLYLHIN